MKKKYYNILELVLIFIITLIFSMVFVELTTDGIWNYGFAYNISTGLIPYRDFNMVTTPLYLVVDALFLIIFGKSVLVHYIYNALICTGIFSLIKKCNPQSYYIPYAMLMIFSGPTYNILCLLFLYIILTLEKKNKYDYLIGIILGLTFLTKQNIGIYLCIPTLFTKDLKKILKRVVSFIIPNLINLIYLICNKALYQFIDYCFLGVGEFASGNKFITIPTLICLIASILYLIFQYIKTKDIKLLYLLCFFGMSYPIIDPYHIIIPLIPTIGYILNKITLNKKIISTAFVIFISIFSIYNLYEYSAKGHYSFPNKLHTFKYCKIDKNVVNQINILTKFTKNNGKNTFDIDDSGYLIKLENGIQINKYDYFLIGNIGKDGSNKLINDFNAICQKENCTFILNQNIYDAITTSHYSEIYSQYNLKLHEYVVTNYQYSETIEDLGLKVYRNY